MLTAGLLYSECVGLDARAKETCLEDGDQIEIIQFAMMLEHFDRTDLIRTVEEEGQ